MGNQYAVLSGGIGGAKLVLGLSRVIVLDRAKDLLTVHLLSALVDDGVANLSDEHEQACWRVVVL